MKWTENQLKAINEEGKILVSAAAGSGKTAVLIERMIKIVTEKKVDIDKIVIVTFTKAAAKEMKERMQKAIMKRLEENGNDPFLRKQLRLLPKANISTLHSYCFRIIKENFWKLDISPNVKIASEEEIYLLKEEIIDKILEEEYEKKEEIFIQNILPFVTHKGDESLKEIIKNLIEFLDSLPFPKEWMQEKILEMEEILLEEEMQGIIYTEIGKIILKNVYQDTKYAKTITESAKSLLISKKHELGGVFSDDKYFKIIDLLENEIRNYENIIKGVAENILGKENIVQLKNRINKIGYERWVTVRGLTEELANIKSVRDMAKETFVKEVQKIVIPSNIKELKYQIIKNRDTLKALYQIINKYYEIYTAKKREKNILDYSDLEKLTIRLLYDKKEEKQEQKDGKKISIHREILNITKLEESLKVEEIFGKYIESFEKLNKEEKYKFSELSKDLRKNIYEIAVDEYQDINMVQDYIIRALTNERIFQVGDPKQSIYGFRNARPELFVNKESGKDGETKIIHLDQNFRSLENVLEITNNIFSRSMKKDTGIIEYTKDHFLNKGRYVNGEYIGAEKEIDKYTKQELEEELKFYRTEIVNIETEDIQKEEESIDEEDPIYEIGAVEKEAIYIAQRIEDLKKEYENRDKKLENRDIVILLRSLTYAGTYQETLEKLGIETYTDSVENFLEIPEVSLVCSYLQILDNPLNDIELLAVLRSYYFQMEIDEITILKLCTDEYGCMNYYSRIMKYIEKMYSTEYIPTIEEKVILKKLEKFASEIKRLRNLERQKGIYSLVKEIVVESGYMTSVAIEGKMRLFKKKNLQKLLSKAEELENAGIFDLQYFNKQIEEASRLKIPLDADKVTSEDEDVVRIMTIHKSKGLEFPVVIIANTAKKRNIISQSEKIRFSEKLGIGIDIIEEKLGISYESLFKNLINIEKRNEEREEELRVLYVAMTRAVEKLIITTKKKETLKNLEKIYMETFVNSLDGRINAKYIINKENYMDIILACIFEMYIHGNRGNLEILKKDEDPETLKSIGADNQNLKYIKHIDKKDSEIRIESNIRDSEKALEDIQKSINIISNSKETTGLDKENMAIFDIKTVMPDVGKLQVLNNENTENENVGKQLYKYDPEKIDIEIDKEIQKLVKQIKNEEEKLKKYISQKLSVSNITTRKIEEQEKTNYKEKDLELNEAEKIEEIEDKTNLLAFDKPKFILDEELKQEKYISGKERGSIVHGIFERLPIIKGDKKEVFDQIAKYLNSLVENEIYTEKEIKYITVEQIYKFTQTETYKQIVENKDGIYREHTIYLKLSKQDAEILNEMLKDNLEEEIVEGQIIQGVIDLYIVDEKEKMIYLIDYKTDRNKTEEELKNRYKVQLSIYEYALKKKYGKQYGYSKKIYSTSLSKEIKI